MTQIFIRFLSAFCFGFCLSQFPVCAIASGLNIMNCNGLMLFDVKSDTIQGSELHQPKVKLNASRPHIWWALTHPFVAPKALKISKKAMTVTDSLLNAGTLNDGAGGKLDAFRHGYWMLLLADNIGANRAVSLGLAHEKANFLNFRKGRPYSSYHNSLMDSINNSLAVRILTDSLPANKFVSSVIDSVNAGYFVVIKKNESGESLSCGGQKVDKSCRIWRYDECLIRSDGREFILEL